VKIVSKLTTFAIKAAFLGGFSYIYELLEDVSNVSMLS